MSSPKGLGQRFLVPLMSRRQSTTYLAFVFAWAAATSWFWYWWLQPEHNIGAARYLTVTFLLAWITVILPAFFLWSFSRSRVPSGRIPVPTGLRVAMVVTKAPSEPFPVVRETLEAMLRQTYPHDTWLADEDPSQETLAWCRDHGVMVSTRKGCPDYHRTEWPRRTRCKEGNLAFFYDHFGYDRYDVVSQLDADHVPTETYLEEIIRPFADPTVGYVSAPSICDRNAAESWAARSRLYVEGAMHGALQMGYTGAFAPMCIGSHYAVRTAAVREIGGIGPELAEDHSTTLLMNAHGWRGVHAGNAIAHGDGPATFSDLATQEFQWSRSLMTILLSYTPTYFSKLPFKLKLQFAFCQLWYPVTALVFVIAFALPSVALLTDANLAGVTYVEFVVYFSLMGAILTFLVFWMRRQGWLRPFGAKVVSWEGGLFVLARWPWVLLGTLAAVADRFRRKAIEFRVTPKGRPNGAVVLPFRVLLPYVLLTLWLGLPPLILDNVQVARGFYFIAAFGSLMYATLIAVIVLQQKKENALAMPLGQRRTPAVAHFFAATMISLVVIPVAALWRHGEQSVTALSWYQDGPLINFTRPGFAGEAIRFGIYDPARDFSASADLGLEHIFVYWQSPASAIQIGETWNYARNRGRTLLVTVEPWTRAPNWRDGADELFPQMLRGEFDEDIERVCREIGRVREEVLVRWGHEMEGPNDRYPWAQRDPAEFVDGFRYFVRMCRGYAPEARFLWSPIGHGSLSQYYPGDQFVDLVGLSLYGLEAWDVGEYGRPRSLHESLEEKYRLVANYGKPIVLAEFGVSGSDGYRLRWLQELGGGMSAFPMLQGVVYFNEREPHHWPKGYGSPDWRVSPERFPPSR